MLPTVPAVSVVPAASFAPASSFVPSASVVSAAALPGVGSAPGVAAGPFPPAAPQGGGGFGVIAIQILLFIAIFYFILIRPQRRERQRHQEMLKKLGKGDQVMTNGGILGQIVHATEHELTVRTAESTRLVVDRGHVARKIEDSPEADAKPSEASGGTNTKDAKQTGPRSRTGRGRHRGRRRS